VFTALETYLDPLEEGADWIRGHGFEVREALMASRLLLGVECHGEEARAALLASNKLHGFSFNEISP
jgi:hypothetical protein